MTDENSSKDVLQFPPKAITRRGLPVSEIETIGFLTKDDRSIYIKKPDDIARIMAFIKQNQITLFEELS